MRRGFTLREILVLTALLFIVAALAMPILLRPHGGRLAARRAVCQSNLKKIGLAFA